MAPTTRHSQLHMAGSFAKIIFTTHAQGYDFLMGPMTNRKWSVRGPVRDLNVGMLHDRGRVGRGGPDGRGTRGGHREGGEGKGRGENGKLGALAPHLTSYPSLPSLPIALIICPLTESGVASDLHAWEGKGGGGL